MTSNQVAYWSMIENRRSNLAREQEQNRANLANEDLKTISLGEEARHNVVTEQETHDNNVARNILNGIDIGTSFLTNVQGNAVKLLSSKAFGGLITGGK